MSDDPGWAVADRGRDGVSPRLHALPSISTPADRAECGGCRRGRRSAYRLLAATLDRLDRGALVLDRGGCVVHANSAARRVLGRTCGVSLCRRHLGFESTAAAEAFDRMLCSGEDSLVLRIPGRTPDRTACRMLVSRLRSGGVAEGYCVFLFSADTGRRPFPESMLREVYGLTCAEARFANALFVERSLGRATATLGVSINTGKSTLKRIFAKCEVRTQAELLQLLSLGPCTS